MIPDFDQNGYLPPGVHRATLTEIDQRFGGPSPERRELMQSVRWLVEMCLRDDVLRLVINGSFVTAKPDPGDVDCALLGGPTFGQHGISIHEWRTPIPFIHLEIGNATIFQRYVSDVFASDVLLRLKEWSRSSMRLKSRTEAENTRAKLARLEELYANAQKQDMATPELKQLSLFSLRRMINQFKEELIRFECDVKSGRIREEATHGVMDRPE